MIITISASFIALCIVSALRANAFYVISAQEWRLPMNMRFEFAIMGLVVAALFGVMAMCLAYHGALAWMSYVGVRS